jgi:hypothetical protein
MNIKSLSLLAWSLALLLNACSPFTIVSSSGEQPTPVTDSITAEETQPNLKPVPIEHVDVQVGVGSPIPVEIVASGDWPDLCSQIAEVKSEMHDFQIDVTILASTVEPCPPVTQGLPFRFALPLSSPELPDGLYTITVNGTSTTFEWPLR